ncbi:MAG: metal ABC transporter permease [Candidatus Njordarchaeales archaeon]
MISLGLRILLIAIIGAILAGVTCSIIGVFVVRLKISSIGYAMSHAAFAGAALGLLLDIDPLLIALLFSFIVALLIGPISDRSNLSPEVILGVIFSLNMALAFIFLSLLPTTAASISALSILWGSILTITIDDLTYLSILTTIMILAIVLFFKEFYAILFNRKLAEADGINTKPFYYAILFMAGATVSFSLKIIGGLLVFALIVNPPSTIMQFSYDMKKIIVLSPILGAITCLIGFLLSLITDFPVGSSIVIVSSLLFAISVVVSPKRRVIVQH